jgi:hypothetical protein
MTTVKTTRVATKKGWQLIQVIAYSCGRKVKRIWDEHGDLIDAIPIVKKPQ